jgi:microcystin-dependent protein
MSQPFVGEIRLVGFNFAPVNWQFCAGQIVAISQNDTLFNLIGTTYGGDGQQTFGLPDLRGRVPVHTSSSQGLPIGLIGGVENVTITTNTYPTHTHNLYGSTTTSSGLASPSGNLTGATAPIYRDGAPNSASAMNSAMIGIAQGGNLPHNNLQPFQVLNWIIAMYGVYPSQG